MNDPAARYDRRVPRYTSYPTAPHFTPDVDPSTYAAWLHALPREETLSLYLHIPFCAELCLYCGCHTTVVRRYGPIAAYVDLIKHEIALVARHLGEGRLVSHIHWGGGTPTIVSPKHLTEITQLIQAHFDVRRDAEIAIEIDPRTFTLEHVEALATIGVNRASLGVQDFDQTVQRAVGRIQTFEQTAQAAEWLRGGGIGSLNLDLMYGLPHQTVDTVLRSVTQALSIRPDRVAVFGYAHVPWMKRHQALLPREHLPDAAERLRQTRAACKALREAGYIAIGLDHFAKPGDRLARSKTDGSLRRNFQGYTTDAASTLIGLGTSSVSTLPQGYVQNAPATVAYRDAVAADRLATVRGIALTPEDRLRRAIIERLMCDLIVDLEAFAVGCKLGPNAFAAEIESIDALARDGLAIRDGFRILVPDEARPFLRNVCAVFDRYLSAGASHHSRAW